MASHASKNRRRVGVEGVQVRRLPNRTIGCFAIELFIGSIHQHVKLGRNRYQAINSQYQTFGRASPDLFVIPATSFVSKSP